MADDWETCIDQLWQRLDTMPAPDFVHAMDALARRRPPDDAAALFERAAARDSTGVESEAEPLYRAALATRALDPTRHVRAVIQLASTLRILGALDESERLLRDEMSRRETGRAVGRITGRSTGQSTGRSTDRSTGRETNSEAGQGTVGAPQLDDELRAILALTWIAQGKTRAAAALALTALAPHLSRYRRSVSGNASEILDEARRDPLKNEAG